MTLDEFEDERTRRVLLAIMYEGPFERLASWLLRINPVTLEDRGEPGPVREFLARKVERMNWRWMMRHVRRGTTPHPRWKRRV